jgi:hypothetical protein
MKLLAEDRKCAIFGLWLYHTRIEFHNSRRIIKLEGRNDVWGCELQLEKEVEVEKEKNRMSH